MYMIEVIRKSNGKVADRIEVATYAEVLTFLRSVNTRVFRTAVYS